MSEDISAVHNVTEHCMFANSLLRACRRCRVWYKLSSHSRAATHHCFPRHGRLQRLQQQPRTYWGLTKAVGQALCRCMAGGQETATVTGAVGTIPQLAVPPRPEIPQQNLDRGIRPFLTRGEGSYPAVQPSYRGSNLLHCQKMAFVFNF